MRDAMATEFPSEHVVIIRPTRGWVPVNLRELWAYRELLYFLVWRDLKVRYKQTVLGVVWVVIQPLFMMLVFTFLFGTIARIDTDPLPYALFVFVGLLPWNLFAKGLSEGSTSLVANENLIRKVYFPRLILPAAAVISGLVDFVIGFIPLAGVMIYYRYPLLLAPALLALPLLVVLTVVAASGIAFWLSAIDARYRDVRYTLTFLTSLWLFATPVVYPLTSVPSNLRWLYSLNPMTGIVEGFRWSLFGSAWNFDVISGISMAAVVVLFIGGLFYFRRTERIFADVV